MFRSSPGMDQLTAELQKKSRQIDALDSTINKLNTEVENYKKQLQEVRKDNNARNTRCTELEATNERLVKDLRAKDATMQALTEQVSNLKGSGGRSSPQVRSSIALSRSTSQDTVGSTGEAERLRSEVTQLQAEIERLKSSSSSSTPTAAGARSRGFGTSTSFGAGASVDVNRIRALNDEVSTWKTRAESLMADLKVSQRKTAAAEAEAERANERAARAAEAQAKSESNLKMSQSEVQQLRDLAQQSSRSLQDQLKRSEGESTKFAADADKAGAQMVSLQRRVEALLTEKASLETTAAEALASASKARDLARLAQSNEEQMGKELEDKSVQVAQLFAELERVKAGKEASDAQFEALTSKLNAAHQATAQQEAHTRDLATAVGDTSELAAELQRQLKSERERADAAELAIEAMKSQLALSQAETGSKSEAQRATVEALESSQAQLDALRLEKGDVSAGKDAAETAFAKAELRIKELESLLGQREATITELSDVLDTLRADHDAKSQALATAQAQATHADGALGNLKSKTAAEASEMHEFMSSQSTELEGAVASKAAAELAAREATSAADNARRAAIKSAQDLENLQEEFDELKAGLEAETERAEALSQLLSDREAELSSLRQQLAEKESVALQADSLREQTELDGQRLKDADDRHASMSDDLAAAKEEILGKQKSLDLAMGTIKDQERKMEGLREELKEGERKMEDLRAALEDAEDRIAQYEQEKTANSVNIGDARSAARDAELAAADARKEADYATRELQKMKDELEETKMQLTAAEKTINQLGDAAEDVRATASADLDWKRKATALEAELESNKAELHATRADAEAEKQRLEAVNAIREAEVEELRKSPLPSPVKAPAPAVVAAAVVEEDDDEEDHESLAKSLVASAINKVVGGDDE